VAAGGVCKVYILCRGSGSFYRDLNMPHPTINPVGSVKQVSGVLGAVTVKSTVLRDVDRLLRKAGTYVRNYQVAHSFEMQHKCSAVRCKTNECSH
jgi:hypothetical protein